MLFYGIHLTTILQEALKIPFHKIGFEKHTFETTATYMG